MCDFLDGLPGAETLCFVKMAVWAGRTAYAYGTDLRAESFGTPPACPEPPTGGGANAVGAHIQTCYMQLGRIPLFLFCHFLLNIFSCFFY
jgi:hypothetical protein